jgi:heme-degrading monooxygenase HmoA
MEVLPMPFMIIRKKVKDYKSWKSVFDEHGKARKAAGSKGGRLFRRAGDPNEIVALFEWDSLDHAKTFTQSEDTLATMKRAGMIGTPDIYFLEEIEKTTL